MGSQPLELESAEGLLILTVVPPEAVTNWISLINDIFNLIFKDAQSLNSLS